MVSLLSMPLNREQQAAYRQQLEIRKARNGRRRLQPTDELPGSEAKIKVLEQRFALGLPMHHADDARMADITEAELSQERHVVVGANGRFIERTYLLKGLAGLYEKFKTEKKDYDSNERRGGEYREADESDD